MAALAIGRNVRNHDYKAHGAAVISLSDGTLLNEYHTKGPLQTLAISSDGRYVAGIEVPAVTAEGNLLGAYRLHIWDREKRLGNKAMSAVGAELRDAPPLVLGQSFH